MIFRSRAVLVGGGGAARSELPCLGAADASHRAVAMARAGDATPHHHLGHASESSHRDGLSKHLSAVGLAELTVGVLSEATHRAVVEPRAHVTEIERDRLDALWRLRREVRPHARGASPRTPRRGASRCARRVAPRPRSAARSRRRGASHERDDQERESTRETHDANGVHRPAQQRGVSARNPLSARPLALYRLAACVGISPSSRQRC